MEALITLNDFNKLAETVKTLMDGRDTTDPINSVTIEYEPHPGGYSLFVEVAAKYSNILGRFRTEIVGDD